MSIIITTSDLETYTGETLDVGRASQVVDAVNEYIESVTGRSWGEVQSGEETHDFASVVFLRHQDVVAVTDVERGQGTGSRTTVSPDSYFVNALGRLVLNEGRVGFQTQRDYIHVTYTYGLLGVPADLKLSALALAADFYAYATEGGVEVSSEQVGSYKLAYARGEATSSGATLTASFERYKTRRV